jgi:hypothetical protein
MIKMCPTCGKEMLMYYVPYCNTCDAVKIIKGKRKSICIVPFYDWMEEHLEGFKEFEKEHETQTTIVENSGGNDTYYEHSMYMNEIDKDSEDWEIVENKRNEYFIQALEKLGITGHKEEIFFWISW